jgi:signal transduction histidine kinase
MLRNKRFSKGRRARIVFMILATYVFFQLAWWARLLFISASDLFTSRTTSQIVFTEASTMEAEEQFHRTIMMIVGEGSFFTLLFVFGMYWVSRLLKAEEQRRERERSFMLAVTHELKTPISAVRLAIDTLDRLDDLTQSQKSELINEARSGSDRLERRINDILEATRLNLPDALVSIPFDIEETLLDSINEFEVGSKTFVINFTKSGIHDKLVEGDEKMWQMCFMNLIENAEKYCSEQGVLDIHLSLTSKEVQISFTDNGPGINKEFKDKVFEAFYRMDRDKQVSGTGLGLHLVDRIVSMHGATISLEAKDGLGAKFVISWTI